MEKVDNKNQKKAPQQEITVEVTKRPKIQTDVRAGSYQIVTIK